MQHSNAKERRKSIADMVWRIIIFSRVAYKPPQQTLLYNTRRANAMTAIEKMLTGKMDMCAFMDLFKSDQNVQETML